MEGGREGAAPVMKSMWTEGQNLCEITRQACFYSLFSLKAGMSPMKNVQFLIYRKYFWGFRSSYIDGHLKTFSLFPHPDLFPDDSSFLVCPFDKWDIAMKSNIVS